MLFVVAVFPSPFDLQLHGAISEYKAAMELGSSLYWVRYNLGALYERRGEHDEAVSYYEQVWKDFSSVYCPQLQVTLEMLCSVLCIPH